MTRLHRHTACSIQYYVKRSCLIWVFLRFNRAFVDIAPCEKKFKNKKTKKEEIVNKTKHAWDGYDK